MKKVLLGAVVVLAVAVVAYAVWSFVVANGLRTELARIRAAGEPLTFQNLDSALPPIDPTEDAAPLYKAALELAADFAAEDSKALDELLPACGMLEPGESPQPAIVEQAADLLQKGAPILDLLDKAERCPNAVTTLAFGGVSWESRTRSRKRTCC